MFQTFYFATTRRIVSAFGTVFNNISIVRTDANGNEVQTIKVPLSYGPKHKWLRAIQEQAQRRQIGGKTNIRMLLPRMSFEMTGMEYDASRKLTTMISNTDKILQPQELTSMLKQLNPIPYKFNFALNIMSKNLDDGLQIIEQILPYFTPNLSVTLKDIPQLGITRDLQIIYKSITHEDSYDGELATTRMITWKLEFTVLGHLYPPITDAKIIKKVIANIYNDPAMQNKIEELDTYVEQYKIDQGIVDLTDPDSIFDEAITDIIE